MTNDELRKLAEAARWDWGNYYWYEGTVEDVDAVDAAYITAASPDRILSLLDEVDHLLEMHVSLLAIRPTRGELRDENELLRAAVEMAIDYAGNPSDTNECTISSSAFEEKWGLVGDLSDMRLVGRWRTALASVKETTDE